MYSKSAGSLFSFLQDVIPDWQQAASNILVAVGNKHINDIMEEILTKFQPGVLPHFFVVQTLASLSDSNSKREATHNHTTHTHNSTLCSRTCSIAFRSRIADLRSGLRCSPYSCIRNTKLTLEQHFYMKTVHK